MSNDAVHIIQLKEAAEARLGYPFRGPVQPMPDGGTAVVQLKNADPEQDVDWPALVRTELKGRKQPDWLQPGDVLFSARGSRNVAIFIDKAPERAVCAPQFFLLRVKGDLILPAFLAWYLNQAPAQRYFAQSAEGSMITSIRRAVLEDLPVPVPTLDRQEIIAKLNNAVRREKQLIQKLLFNREQQLRLVAKDLIE